MTTIKLFIPSRYFLNAVEDIHNLQGM